MDLKQVENPRVFRRRRFGKAVQTQPFGKPFRRRRFGKVVMPQAVGAPDAAGPPPRACGITLFHVPASRCSGSDRTKPNFFVLIVHSTGAILKKHATDENQRERLSCLY